jgi:hypothetical protein
MSEVRTSLLTVNKLDGHFEKDPILVEKFKNGEQGQ